MLQRPHLRAESAELQGKEEYVIGIGDVLEVLVWHEPELSRKIIVRLDGKISLPLAGEMEATGKTIYDLTQSQPCIPCKFI